jgi:hypothetical protein
MQNQATNDESLLVHYLSKGNPFALTGAESELVILCK